MLVAVGSVSNWCRIVLEPRPRAPFTFHVSYRSVLFGERIGDRGLCFLSTHLVLIILVQVFFFAVGNKIKYAFL